jgi:hypothetical protein
MKFTGMGNSPAATPEAKVEAELAASETVDPEYFPDKVSTDNLNGLSGVTWPRL